MNTDLLVMQNVTKTQDALNRAVRTVIQFVIVDVLVTVIPEILATMDNEEMDWDRIGRSAIRVALGGVLAYVMRLKVPPQETPPPVPAAGGE